MVTANGEKSLAQTTREEGGGFIHRVKILNLPSREMGTVKKLLQSFDLHKFKKAPKWDYAYMNFEVNLRGSEPVFIQRIEQYFRQRKQLDQLWQN